MMHARAGNPRGARGRAAVAGAHPPAGPSGRRRSALAVAVGGAGGARATAALLALAGPPPPARAAVAGKGSGEEGAPALVPFEDPGTGFRLDVPAGWDRGEAPFPGSPPGALWSWVSLEDPDATVTVVVKPISVEFTKMGSFGDVDTWADNIIAAMDNSWQYERARKRAEAAGKRWEEPTEYSEAVLLKAGPGPGGMYAAEYTVRAGGAPAAAAKRVSVASGLSLRPVAEGAPPPRASDGRTLPSGNLLFTVTGSCPKARSAVLLPLLQRSVGSFRMPAPRQ